MTDSTEAPYGAWESPITAESLAAGARRFEQVIRDGEDILWVERRPDEKGRSVCVRWTRAGGAVDVTPVGFNARTLVNSYGGGAVAAHDGVVWFANFAQVGFPGTNDQRIHRQEPDHIPVPITPQVHARYADLTIDPARGRLYCVMEDSSVEQNGQPKQSLVALDADGRRAPLDIASGADFYAAPRLSPCGGRIAWFSWNYPAMPWEATELWVADLDEAGAASNARKLAGDPATGIDPKRVPAFQEMLRGSGESALEPRFSPGGALIYVSDAQEAAGDRWWNLRRAGENGPEPITREAAEFASPPWRLGGSSWDFISEGEILATFTTGGVWKLARIDVATGALTEIETPFTSIAHLTVLDGVAVFIGAAFDRPAAVIRWEIDGGAFETIRSAGRNFTDAVRACVSTPEAISYSTGADGSEVAHAWHYPPANPAFHGPETSRPPLLIFIHGGPTAAAGAGLSMDVQFFTSRGFAVVDVNYRGGAGFGRRYRQALYGEWGVADLEDCRRAAEALIEADKVDRYRIASRGGSAGGYTTLALATFTDILSVAASYYGVADLEMIARHTDKLEARYLDLLVGPLPAGEKIYKARSPVNHPDRVNCPLILFQGLDDPIVPPEQAKVMIAALEKRGLPVAYEFYEHESHGFRIRANIVKSIEEELSFYGMMLGFTPAGALARPVVRRGDGAA